MNLNLGSLDAEFARGLCQMLCNKNNNMPGQNQANVAAIFMNGAPSWRSVGDSTDHPAAIRFDNENATVFIVLGARDNNQAVRLCNGYLTKPNERNPTGFNPYAEICADALIDALGVGHGVPKNRLIFAAHSWGGPVAMSMAAKYAQGDANRTVSICTFGAPMAGDGRVGQRMANFDLARWMNRGDHVPFMPPSRQQAPSIALLLGPLYGNVQPDFRQFGNGRELELDGHAANRMYPSGEYVYTDLSLLAFAASNDAPIAIAHALDTYLFRIDAYFHSLPANTPPIGGYNKQSGTNPTAPSPPGAEPPAAVPGEPPPFLVSNRPPVPVGTPDPYTHVKVNGISQVMFQDQTIAVTKSRRAARDLARSLNTTWRRWYRTQAGDGPALAASVAASFPS